jgi:hypothetical protein
MVHQDLVAGLRTYIDDTRIAPTAIVVGEENSKWRLRVVSTSVPWFVKRKVETTLHSRS